MTRSNIIERGQSIYRIIIGKTASPSETFAAEELQGCLEQMTGVRLPIVSEETASSPHEIVLGQYLRAAEVGLKYDSAEWGCSGFQIFPHGKKLFILGSPERGTLYGVYSWLEDDLGCCWYAPEIAKIPALDHVPMPLHARAERPAFQIREVPYKEFLDNPVWAARNRVSNTWAPGMESRHGGGSPWAGRKCHTFEQLVSPEQHFATHPAYFALVNGKRTPDGQLCLTNPDVLQLVIEQVRVLLQTHPGKTLVSVSQNDKLGVCECDECKLVDREEESNAGTMIQFVNGVAQAIALEFPEATIHTFAYQYTRKPPKNIRPRHNVLVEVCSIECSFAEPIRGGVYEQNQAFVKDMEAWRMLGARLAVWDYVVQFDHYLIPFPNFHVLAANARFFRDCGVESLIAQANYESPGGDMSLLRGWVLSKLLWSPDKDAEALIRQFVSDVYQESAGPIMDYLAYLTERALNTKPILLIQGALPESFYTEQFACEVDALLAKAEALATTPAIRDRVERARLATRYACLILCADLQASKFSVRDGVYSTINVTEGSENARLLFEIAEREGVTHHRQFSPLAELKRQKGLCGLRYPVITREDAAWRIQVVPELGGRMISLRPAGRDVELLYQADPSAATYPASGGFEESVGVSFRKEGFAEVYGVITGSSSSGPLQVQVPLKRFVLSRTYAFVDSAALQIETSLSTWLPESTHYQIRSRAIFSFGDFDRLEIMIQGCEGLRRYRAAALAGTSKGSLQDGGPGKVLPEVILFAPDLGLGVRLGNVLAERLLILANAHEQSVSVEWISPTGELSKYSPGPQARPIMRQRMELVNAAALPAAHLQKTFDAIPETSSCIVLQEHGFEFYRDGVVNFIVPDPLASNGYAGVIDFSQGLWSGLRCPVGQPIVSAGTYDAWVYLRLSDPTHALTHAVAIVNVYDQSRQCAIHEQCLRVADLAAQGWTPVYVGRYVAKPSLYVTVVSPPHTSVPARLLVDRVECFQVASSAGAFQMGVQNVYT